MRTPEELKRFEIYKDNYVQLMELRARLLSLNELTILQCVDMRLSALKNLLKAIEKNDSKLGNTNSI